MYENSTNGKTTSREIDVISGFIWDATVKHSILKKKSMLQRKIPLVQKGMKCPDYGYLWFILAFRIEMQIQKTKVSPRRKQSNIHTIDSFADF